MKSTFITKDASADGGYANGCSSLGILYGNGEGVKRNYFKAKEFYGKACDLKDQLSCEIYATLNK